MPAEVVTREEFNLLGTKLANLETAVAQLKLERQDLMDGITELSLSLAAVAADVATLMARMIPPPPRLPIQQ